jgi:hypothetical protein
MLGKSAMRRFHGGLLFDALNSEPSELSNYYLCRYRIIDHCSEKSAIRVIYGGQYLGL